MLVLKSPAKLNLFLRVTARNSNGYHDLASLFQTIDLCDEITLDVSETDQFICDDPTLPLDASNLVIKARELFRVKTNDRTPLSIVLKKKIPAQAGLGGGSGNAATVLWGMNQLLNAKRSEQELLTWSAEIGSDIPFFFSHGTAYCTGRGENVQDLLPLKKESLILVKPLQGLATASVFKALDLNKLNNRSPERSLQEFIAGKNEFYNDLEAPAFSAMPELSKLKEKLLNSGFKQVCMTGSGSALMCFGEGEIPEGLQTFKTAYLNRAKSSWY